MSAPYVSSYDQTISFTDTCAQIHLTASTVTTYTVPTDSAKYIVTFACPSNAAIFVGYNSTPTIPGANTAATGWQIEMVLPGMKRFAIAGDVLSFITADTVDYLSLSLRSSTG